MIIDDTVEENTGHIGLGCTVRVQDLDTGDEETYEIVGSQEANPMLGCISDDSPFGRAMVGKAEGEIVEVDAPVGVLKFKILSVEKRI